MIREILFRGKTKRNEWIYGDLITHGIDFDDAIKQHHTREVLDIIPGTVGEYTGIKDKNGKKIFEGDIVVYAGESHEVVFETKNNSAYFGIKISSVETWQFGNYVEPKRLEVIGNIHDNKELLGV